MSEVNTACFLTGEPVDLKPLLRIVRHSAERTTGVALKKLPDRISVEDGLLVFTWEVPDD